MKLAYDYIEYYVGMARMVVYWHVQALGFDLVAYQGPETGNNEKISYFLTKGKVKLGIAAAAQPNNYDIISYIDRHGNGVKRFALNVSNIDEAFQAMVSSGAIPLSAPVESTDKYGSVSEAVIKIFDDNEIVLIDYGSYQGPFKPGFEPWSFPKNTTNDGCNLLEVDHIACALRENEINIWENYFNRIFGSKTVQTFDRGEVQTTSSGLHLKVLQSEDTKINNVLVEPVNKSGKSQIQTFLDTYHGSGIQHVAFSCEDIFSSISSLKEKGVQFTTYPDSYYQLLHEKFPSLDVEKLKEYGVLCDVEGDSLLLQTFTLPLGDRPTFFYELIQRINNYNGFGLGNINTLFEAVEKEMATS